MSDYGSTPAPPPEGGYGQAMPQMTQGGAPLAGRPAAMEMAVKLMKVGAVLSLLQALSSLLFKGQIRDAVTKSSANSTTHLTPEQINTAVNSAMIVAVVAGLIAAGLWLWMASANGKGKSWARIVSTVFFVLSLLSLISALVQGATPIVSLILSILVVLVGGYVIFLLYKKESTDFYRAASAPRM